ncbi:Predicted glycosyltransferase (Putative glycosylt ransferase) [Umezakia ovalisporum]|uniref:Glycosyltransferase family 2 protein n=2 Tax=Umezakia ovalisporum TaxID=75695 RepID=A0AA43GWJ0_9CYAN|nr:glycosyltransferase family 2 protein [Umezakia ovalisporum]MBI1243165.1 glycosyltransferase [Nostoc sp. RI_552]MDH6062555.1 glycosyltransferase family 2 protein [Umezakia ovalisporum FSS-62]MDH6073007.1 glycosyltransferase family 2 protein [Umezakia ovalisporum CS-1034]MDH6077776.1 glycosyltransferase family 2 protein [Umezakia ovalisporum FSS-45]MDH6083227.1 glycosyltransferase family 2 protein [Umezakia ovalisporum FSS-44]
MKSYFSGFLAQSQVQTNISRKHIMKVAVIVHTHHKLNSLLVLLEDIYKQKLYKTEIHIYIVGNTWEFLNQAHLQKFDFAHIQVLQTGKYLGNSGCFYYGLRFVSKLRYDYIWLLNDDVRLDPLALNTLITTLQENDEVGLVSSQVYQIQEPKTIEEFGRLINNYKPESKIKFGNQKNVVSEGILKSKPYIQVDSCGNKSLLLRHKIVNHVGVLKDYFLHSGDIDLCLRVKKAGWIIAVNPSSIIWYDCPDCELWHLINYDYECNFYYWQKYRPDFL